MLKVIKDIVQELKSTSWPKPLTLANLVVYTIVVCGIIAVLILGLDVFLLRVRDLIL